MQYSVSPRLKLSSFGPKPSENVITRTPMRRAIRKWPSSCTKISTPRTNRKARALVTMSPGRLRNRLYPSPSPGGELARPPVDRAHVVQAGDRRRAVLLERVHRQADDFGDAHEAQAGLEECRHGDLVRRVQHDRQPFRAAQRAERQR